MKKDGDICLVAPGSPRCWAVSSSDTAPVLWSLGAHVRLASAAGERTVPIAALYRDDGIRSEEHTSELQSRLHLVCRLLLEKKNGLSPWCDSGWWGSGTPISGYALKLSSRLSRDVE